MSIPVPGCARASGPWAVASFSPSMSGSGASWGFDWASPTLQEVSVFKLPMSNAMHSVVTTLVFHVLSPSLPTLEYKVALASH